MTPLRKTRTLTVPPTNPHRGTQVSAGTCEQELLSAPHTPSPTAFSAHLPCPTGLLGPIPPRIPRLPLSLHFCALPPPLPTCHLLGTVFLTHLLGTAPSLHPKHTTGFLRRLAPWSCLPLLCCTPAFYLSQCQGPRLRFSYFLHGCVAKAWVLTGLM